MASGTDRVTGAPPSRFPGRPAKRLTFLIGVRDHLSHGSLEMELLKRARRAQIAGVTVFEANQGFGASGQVHRERLLSDDRPLAIVFIDRPERIDAFVEEVSSFLDGVVVTVDDIEILDL